MSFIPRIYLVDNGSLRPSATFALRRLAGELSERVGRRVEPVSLLHSNKIPPGTLGGLPAKTVRSTMRRALESGSHDFIFLPLFLGPSRAITEYLPELIDEARQSFPTMRSIIGNPLAGSNIEDLDLRLIEILARLVRKTCEEKGLVQPDVALVDHGTPYRPVNELRNRVADLLGDALKDEVNRVIAASMERRAGDEYAFNEPLLEKLGEDERVQAKELLCSMFFLLPGRHAGEGGDVNEICDGMVAAGSFSRIERTPLISEDTGLIEILADRLAVALDGFGEN